MAAPRSAPAHAASSSATRSRIRCSQPLPLALRESCAIVELWNNLTQCQGGPRRRYRRGQANGRRDPAAHRIDRRSRRRRAAADDPRRPPRARRAPARDRFSERLGVARHTFRAATQILIGEGLLRRVPNRGVQLAVLDADDISDIFKLRAALELEAVRLVDRRRAGPSTRRSAPSTRSTASRDDATWRSVVDADMDFHRGDHRRRRQRAAEPRLRHGAVGDPALHGPAATPLRPPRSEVGCRAPRSARAASRRRARRSPRSASAPTSTRPTDNLTNALEGARRR